MSSLQPPQAECKWCGETFPAGTEKCPQCGRPVPAVSPQWVGPHSPAEDRARREEPGRPALGQAGFLSNAWRIASSDWALVAVIAFEALNLILAIASGEHGRTVYSGLTFLGLVTFRRWGYWLAMVSAGLSLLAGGLLTAVILLCTVSGGDVPPSAVASGVGYAATMAAVMVVLYRRRDRFG